MSGTRGTLARIVAMGVALALALLLLAAKEATAGKYEVAECGWHLGADARWADTTGGVKFRPDSYCATPPNEDPFDGAHLKSLTRDGQQSVSGTRFARWRWEAPLGTGITRVSGTWWQALHDGFEQRLAIDNGNGTFDVFAAAAATDTTPRPFVAGFDPPRIGFEDRLLCARGEDRWCSLDSPSWSAIRALTLTIEDDHSPEPAVGGDLTGGGWRRGAQNVDVWATDTGAGIRFGETTLDGTRAGFTEFPCAKEAIGGSVKATAMGPCSLAIGATQTVATTSFVDGPHMLVYCAADFAGNFGCTPQHRVLIDNNPPAHPRNLALVGDDGWRRQNDFDLTWANPDQGLASPIGGASWRIEGPGYDSGVKFSPGHDLTALSDLSLPHAGSYSLSIWLRDEAGNESPPSAISVPLRLDDVPPTVAFDPPPADGSPPLQVSARLTDAHSGPAGGEIHIRRLDAQQWTELPAQFQRDPASADAAELVAAMPQGLAPGTYVFRADALDAAGNQASTTRRADGGEMVVHVPDPAPSGIARGVPARGARPRTRIFAHLLWHRHAGSELTVPFGAAGELRGRLVDAGGAGLAGRTLRVVVRPSRGAFARASVAHVATGPHGAFALPLPPGPSRRVAVSFAGDDRLERAIRAPLTLRVRAGIGLNAAPRALRTGQAVRLGGRVRSRGAPLPRRGKLVAIQYFETATGRWRPILVTRSDHSGRFQARYRFRYVTGTASIRLRALALAEDRWPYAPGASRALRVRVTG